MKKDVFLIVTYDLSINQTSTFRYFSFINALNAKGNVVKAIGVNFPFKSNPINSLDKLSISNLTDHNNVLIIRPIRNNFLQKLLALTDKIKTPYFIKKFLLAIHIVFYKTDQWTVNEADFSFCDSLKPSIIISGGSGGLIKSSYLLAKKYNAKLIIDYRDPWNFGYQLLETNSFIHFFKKRFTLSSELKFLEFASHIITVSDTLKSFFPERFQHKISVIENGSNFDTYDNEYVFKSKTFNITYIGTLYNDQLTDQSFFIALHEFISENRISFNQLKLQFTGSLNNKNLIEILKKFNLDLYTNITSRFDLNDLKEVLQDSWMFLHLKYGNRKGIITSKNADYLFFNKPILLPNTDNGDIAESILNNKSGYVCNGEINEIKGVLNLEFQRFINGEDPRFLNQNHLNITRSEIAKKLYNII